MVNNLNKQPDICKKKKKDKEIKRKSLRTGREG
jgi:hypothetical protein